MTTIPPSFDAKNPYIELMLRFHENTKLRKTSGGGFGWNEISAHRIAAWEGTDPVQGHFQSKELETLASKLGVTEIFAKRKSTRHFSGLPISWTIIASLTFSTVGGRLCGEEQKLFFNPTAGNLRSSQLAWLRYEDASNSWELAFVRHGSLFRAGTYDDYIVKNCFLDPPAGTSSICLVHSDFGRLVSKYGARGYRYAFLDAGHLMQNLYLCCADLKIGIHSSCGFTDNECNSLLALDGKKNSVVYCAYLGHPGESKSEAQLRP